jgi:SAM-dependent methyltransferase
MTCYHHPKYYDLSYSHDMQDELVFLKRIFGSFNGAHHPRLLEPACGTGRLLVPLARAGFQCTGFDVNPRVIDYLTKKLKRNALEARCFSGDMNTVTLTRAGFEGAYCTVDTFRHLPSDQQAVGHLQLINRALTSKGIYVVGLHVLPKRGIRKTSFRWRGARGRLQVHTTITILDVDSGRREETLGYTLRVTTPSAAHTYRSVYKLRTYTLDQFKRTVSAAGGFEIIGVYDVNSGYTGPVIPGADAENLVFLLGKNS